MIMDKNRLSIIVPVYNAEEYLDRCLISILEQDFVSYEVILVDDGSTDSSPMICDRYSATDPRFRTIHKENGGVSSARNAGLDLAKGEYVMFVDSDDALLPDALDALFEGLAGEDIAVGGYTVYLEGTPGREVFPRRNCSYRGEDMNAFYIDNIRKNCEMLDAPWSKVFRRKAIGDMRFCEDLSYAEDKLFVFTFLTKCSSAHTCAFPLYAYHVRAGSLGSDVRSDRHLIQLRRFLPSYAQVLSDLAVRYPSNKKINSLYHKDVVGRYLCRIMNIFLCRRTQLLDADYIGWVYSMMDADKELGLFSVRAGQILNILLYKLGNRKFSVRVYRACASVASLFRKTR